jgi:hypothetical protein
MALLRLLGLVAVTAIAAACTLATAAAQTLEPVALFTNERYVEEVRRDARIDSNDPMAVFAFVFSALPEQVKVYPTENYYYFRFVQAGVPYAGNIRLAPGDRDNGKLHFGYYEDNADWKRDGLHEAVVLDRSHGIKLERLDALIYRVTYRDKSVIFTLNDVSKIKPPSTLLGPDEIYVGAVFDESALQFFLVFNSKLRVFHYILDETSRVADEFSPAEHSDRILIGKRTGFAFYRDHRLDRKIMIGAFDSNSKNNTYFDGPFDQLPENFIEGENLRNAIIASDPTVKGEIDRLGNFHDNSGRYAIHPYMVYRKESDLLVFHACATDRRVPAASYHRCFVVDVPPDGGIGRPLALREIRGAKRRP